MIMQPISYQSFHWIKFKTLEYLISWNLNNADQIIIWE